VAGLVRPAADELDAGELTVAAILARALGELEPRDAEVAAAVLVGSAEMAAAAIDWAPIRLRVTGDLLPTLVDEYQTTVLDELTRVPLATFDPTLYARQWADVHAGRLITELTESSRLAVVDVVREGLGRGEGIDPIAAGIRRTVGLHSSHALAVNRRLRAMVADGMAPNRAAVLAGRHADKLRRSRAVTIARWEVQSARNMARWQTWEQSYKSGALPPSATKRWVVARPCDICAQLAAEPPVRWNEPFSNGRMMPPEHPRCKCTASIVLEPFAQ
jgi:hypothetical protein